MAEEKAVEDKGREFTQGKGKAVTCEATVNIPISFIIRGTKLENDPNVRKLRLMDRGRVERGTRITVFESMHKKLKGLGWVR